MPVIARLNETDLPGLLTGDERFSKKCCFPLCKAVPFQCLKDLSRSGELQLFVRLMSQKAMMSGHEQEGSVTQIVNRCV